MSDEQPTTGTTVNSGATTTAPRPGTPVMDVVPPPAQEAAPTAEPSVVSAPPEEEIPQISDDIAEQIAADSVTPPAPEPSEATAPDAPQAESAGTSAMASPPEAETSAAPSTGDSPSDLIQAEIKHEADNPAAAITKAPKTNNPAQAAVIATIIITLALAGLAVFAYLSTQN